MYLMGANFRSFGHDKKELKHPCGVCVHGQCVYVTDAISHYVFVFTTHGKHSPHLVRKVRRKTLAFLFIFM